LLDKLIICNVVLVLNASHNAKIPSYPNPFQDKSIDFKQVFACKKKRNIIIEFISI
jgi:hypothetical protein